MGCKPSPTGAIVRMHTFKKRSIYIDVHYLTVPSYLNATTLPSLHCLHYTSFTTLPSLHCLHSTAFTTLPSLHCLHPSLHCLHNTAFTTLPSPFTTLPSLHCLHYTAFTPLPSLHCLHSTAFTPLPSLHCLHYTAWMLYLRYKLGNRAIPHDLTIDVRNLNYIILQNTGAKRCNFTIL